MRNKLSRSSMSQLLRVLGQYYYAIMCLLLPKVYTVILQTPCERQRCCMISFLAQTSVILELPKESKYCDDSDHCIRPFYSINQWLWSQCLVVGASRDTKCYYGLKVLVRLT